MTTEQSQNLDKMLLGIKNNIKKKKKSGHPK